MTDTVLKIPRNSDRFIGVVVTVDGTDQDPEFVAVTEDKFPPPEGDSLWVTPLAGSVRGENRVGLMTGELTNGPTYSVWGVPVDADEFAPVLAFKLKLT